MLHGKRSNLATRQTYTHNSIIVCSEDLPPSSPNAYCVLHAGTWTILLESPRHGLPWWVMKCGFQASFCASVCWLMSLSNNDACWACSLVTYVHKCRCRGSWSWR